MQISQGEMQEGLKKEDSSCNGHLREKKCGHVELVFFFCTNEIFCKNLSIDSFKTGMPDEMMWSSVLSITLTTTHGGVG